MSASTNPKKRDRLRWKALWPWWMLLFLLVGLRLLYFAGEFRAGRLFLAIDDLTRYRSGLVILQGDFFLMEEAWPPLPGLLNAAILFLFSGWTRIADCHLILALNWIFYFATLAVFLTGLRIGPGTTLRPQNLFAAILFAGIPFVHTISVSTMTESLQYLVITCFVYTMTHAWSFRSRSWRAAFLAASAAWMLCRYEAWVVVLAIQIGGAIAADRRRLWRYPYLEPAALLVIAASWLLIQATGSGSALRFSATATVYSIKEVRPYIGILFGTIAISLAPVAIGILLMLHHVIRGRGPRPAHLRRTLSALNGAYVLTGGLLLFVLFQALVTRHWGRVVPERFPIQIAVAFVPAGGQLLSYGVRRLRGVAPVSVQAGAALLLGLGLILWILGFREPVLTFLPYQVRESAIMRYARENDLDVLVLHADIEDLESPHWFKYQFLYSWRRVESIATEGPVDLTSPELQNDRLVIVEDRDRLDVIFESDDWTIKSYKKALVFIPR